MRIHHNPQSDAAYIRLAETDVAESDEVAPGVVLDYDSDGNIIDIEIRDAA
jgi:uncharacterized protein YuzE